MSRLLRGGGIAVAATLLLSIGLLVAPPTPVDAATKPVIRLKPNDRVEAKYAGFPLGAAVVTDQVLGTPPEDCIDGGLQFATCHFIPLELDISNKELEKKKYALSFTLSWTPGDNIVIPATGTLPLTQLSLSIYDNPRVEDDDAPTECPPDDPVVNKALCLVLGPVGGEPGGDEAWYSSFLLNEHPINFGMAPTRNRYGIVITNYYGLNTQFTLKIGFISSADVVDLSIDEDIVSDLSSAPDVEAEAAGIPSVGVSDIIDFGSLADIGSDSDLDSLGLAGDDRLGLSAEELIRSRNVRDIRPRGDESTIALLLWLVLLPLAAVAFGGWWFVRRRSAVFN